MYEKKFSMDISKEYIDLIAAIIAVVGLLIKRKR